MWEPDLDSVKHHTLTTGIPQQMPVTQNLGDEKRPYCLAVFPVLDESPSGSGICGLLLDDTEARDERDDLEAAIEELQTYDHAVSHELTTPLNTLAINVELMREALDRGEGRGELGPLLDRIESGSRNLGAMIRCWLSLPRDGSRRQRPRKVDTEAIVQDAAHLLGIDRETSTELVTRHLPSVWADPDYVRSIFQYLILNAQRATRSREEARILVGSKTLGDEILFYVQDNGRGYEHDEMKALFHTLTPLQTDGDPQEAGLGFAIVKRGMLRRGGRVWAESVPGKGTTVYFTLPAKRVNRAKG